MFNLVLSDMSIEPKRIDSLDKQADSEITIRGYDLDKVGVPPELRRKEWFLPVNEIVSDYCPTDRYLYLTKIAKEKAEPTWESFKGRVIDELYPDLLKALSIHVDHSDLATLQIREALESFKKTRLEEVQKSYEKEKKKLMNPPTGTEFTDFLKGVSKIIRYEIQLCSAIMDFRVSVKKDIRLESEFALLFPFVSKPKLLAPELGFSEGQEPDFIYANRVVCDVKTGKWRDFFLLTLAAYALAFENENKKPMNLGAIVNPVIDNDRNAPLYLNSEIVIIGDEYRKIVKTLRDKKLEFMKNARDPSKPKNDGLCTSCGFHNNSCWREKNDSD